MRILRIICLILSSIAAFTSCKYARPRDGEYPEGDIRVTFSEELGGVLTEGEAEAILLSDGTRLLRVRYSSPRALCDVSCSGRLDRTCGLTAARVEVEGVEIEVEEEIAEALLAPILRLLRGSSPARANTRSRAVQARDARLKI